MNSKTIVFLMLISLVQVSWAKNRAEELIADQSIHRPSIEALRVIYAKGPNFADNQYVVRYSAYYPKFVDHLMKFVWILLIYQSINLSLKRGLTRFVSRV